MGLLAGSGTQARMPCKGTPYWMEHDHAKGVLGGLLAWFSEYFEGLITFSCWKLGGFDRNVTSTTT